MLSQLIISSYIMRRFNLFIIYKLFFNQQIFNKFRQQVKSSGGAQHDQHVMEIPQTHRVHEENLPGGQILFLF